MRRDSFLILLLVLPGLTGCTGVTDQFVTQSAWALKITGIEALHARGTLGRGVLVAVVDTGIDTSHPEFAGVSVAWVDVVGGRTSPYDDNGHGTHVAGIIVGQGKNDVVKGATVKGGSPLSGLIAVKAVPGNGEVDDAGAARGISAAIDGGADVIVLSLGGKKGLLSLGSQTEDQVNRAVNLGVFVVAAAGNKEDPNEDNGDVATPASVQGAIAVGAVDEKEHIAPFSYKGKNTGVIGSIGARTDPNQKPELLAPGVNIVSSWKEGLYVSASGTSQATPYVGAVIALLLEGFPKYQRDGAAGGPSAVTEFKNVFMVTAKKIGPLAGRGPTAHDDYYGYGLVNAAAAFDALAAKG
ncbi:MAG: S8 family serine peptidase [Euryarchaeota archaeon]|nr:S8 family serine peptidase [Euryarchaeota archaeon]